ncbi:2558_t:CDS:1, partial [Paraglomus brasilianum]
MTKNNNLKNILTCRTVETVKTSLLLVAQHVPLIGEVASVAGQILDMMQEAHNNKAICKTIHDVVLSNMAFLGSLDKEEYSNNKSLEDFLRVVYLPTLTEIAKTIEKKKSPLEF